MSPELIVSSLETEQGRSYHKIVELITPDKANELGIPAESPVFVSKYIKKEDTCAHCSTTYTPLVYQVGYTTNSQHIHEGSGGIYLYSSLRKRPPTLVEASRWVAEVEPIGELIQEDDIGGRGMDAFRVDRASAIYVKSIRAYCDIGRRGRHQIQSGVVAPITIVTPYKSTLHKDFLKPFCLSHQGQNPNQPEFSFEISPLGEVMFGMPE